MPLTLALKNLHNKAWGKPWPHLSYGTIEKADITDDGEDGDKDGPLADILHLPISFKYTCLKEMQELTDIFNTQSAMGSVLVIRKEYERLYDALVNDFPTTRCFTVAGHPGIGSYEIGLSFKTSADLYPILRQDNLPILPALTSSRVPTPDGNSTYLRILRDI